MNERDYGALILRLALGTMFVGSAVGTTSSLEHSCAVHVPNDASIEGAPGMKPVPVGAWPNGENRDSRRKPFSAGRRGSKATNL